MLRLVFIILTVCFLGMAPEVSVAQQVSAGSFDALRNAQDTGECRTQSTLLNARLIAVEQLISTVLNCNQNGQVYDQNIGNCVTPDLSPEHRFRQPDAGATLSFRNPNNAFGDVAVVGGAKGQDITCDEDGDVVTDPDTPPTDDGGGNSGQPDRLICRRGGVTWTHRTTAELMTRDGAVTYYCCEGFLESEVGDGNFAGYIARQWPGPREECGN